MIVNWSPLFGVTDVKVFSAIIVPALDAVNNPAAPYLFAINTAQSGRQW